MSVHVFNSNYTQTSAPHQKVVTVPFTQPPTISHTAPSSTFFDITSVFTYQLQTRSNLGQPLTFGAIATNPPGFSGDVNITVLEHDTGANIVGRISISTVLPTIVLNNLIPTVTVPIMDTLGGLVLATTQLRINPSPPIFEHAQYIFSIEENSRGIMLGPIRLIDPNGALNQPIPTISRNQDGASQLLAIIPKFSDSDVTSAYSSYNILVQHRFDYEQIQVIEFQMVAVDSEHRELSSTATVRINITPVNEFSPRFIMNRFVFLII